MIDRYRRILFGLQHTFDGSCFSQGCDPFTCDNFYSLAKPLGCVRMTSQVLREASIEING
jgi:hypothetical protein